MSKPSLDTKVFVDLSWWHWALTVPLLAAHLADWPGAIALAMGLCAAAGIYFYYRLGRVQPYPVQVRIAYFGLLAIGLLPGFHWLHWVQFFGTSAMIAVGYCPLIRLLSLIPPNRTEPLTNSLVWRVFVNDPCAGGLVSWPSGLSSPATDWCSLPAHGAPPTCSLSTTRTTIIEPRHANAH